MPKRIRQALMAVVAATAMGLVGPNAIGHDDSAEPRADNQGRYPAMSGGNCELRSDIDPLLDAWVHAIACRHNEDVRGHFVASCGGGQAGQVRLPEAASRGVRFLTADGSPRVIALEARRKRERNGQVTVHYVSSDEAFHDMAVQSLERNGRFDYGPELWDQMYRVELREFAVGHPDNELVTNYAGRCADARELMSKADSS